MIINAFALINLYRVSRIVVTPGEASSRGEEAQLRVYNILCIGLLFKSVCLLSFSHNLDSVARFLTSGFFMNQLPPSP